MFVIDGIQASRSEININANKCMIMEDEDYTTPGQDTNFAAAHKSFCTAYKKKIIFWYIREAIQTKVKLWTYTGACLVR